MELACPGGHLLIHERPDVGPDHLYLAEEDVGTGRPDTGKLDEQLAEPADVAARFLVQPAQVAVPPVLAELGAVAEHRRRALIVAAIVTAAERVDAVLPARRQHGRRGPVPGPEQLPGGGDRDSGGDPRAQQRRQHEQLVQRRRPVGQPDAGLLREGTPVPVEQYLDHVIHERRVPLLTVYAV
jgi:hypothetical protein